MSISRLRECVLAKNRGWHVPDDHLGPRVVFLDGHLIQRAVIRANERKGRVVIPRRPLKLDKYKKRILTQTLRGNVRVEFV